MTAAPAGSGQGGPGRGRAVAVFGGTGFLGRRVVRHLLGHGFRVRVASRHPERAPSLLGPDGAGVETVGADVHDEASVASALAGAFGACAKAVPEAASRPAAASAAQPNRSVVPPIVNSLVKSRRQRAAREKIPRSNRPRPAVAPLSSEIRREIG